MTIQVFPVDEQEEKELLAFLQSRHYTFESTVDDFLHAYNKELDEAEAGIDAGNGISHADVKSFFAEKRKTRE